MVAAGVPPLEAELSVLDLESPPEVPALGLESPLAALLLSLADLGLALP